MSISFDPKLPYLVTKTTVIDNKGNEVEVIPASFYEGIFRERFYALWREITDVVESGGGGGPGTTYTFNDTATIDFTDDGAGNVEAIVIDDSITYAKMQNVSSASRLIGRGNAGAGDPQEITVTSPLVISGTALTTSMATSRLIGRTTASSGVMEEISVGSGLELAGGTLTASSAPPDVNSQSADYTAVLTDANDWIYHPSSDNNSRTFTIPANASVAYPVGTTLTFVNRSQSICFLSINSDVMALAGATTVETKLPLPADSTFIARKVASTFWIVTAEQHYSPGVLVMNEQGAHNSIYMADMAGRHNLPVIAVNGNTAWTTAQAPTGMSTSVAFDGAGDYLSLPASQAFYWPDDYTIEVFVRYNGTSGTKTIFDFRLNGSDAQRIVIYSDGTNLKALWLNADRITGTLPSNTTWTHIALCRSAGNTKLFKDGTQTGSTVADSTPYIPPYNYQNACNIGASFAGTNGFNGHMCCARFTPWARYPGNFTPPSAPLGI